MLGCSSAAFCGWRNLCQLKATQEEQYALEKLLPFQRRFVFRCLAQWRRLVRIKQAGRALATRRAFRETTRRFSLWANQCKQRANALHLQADKRKRSLLRHLHAWLRWTHKKRVLFLNALYCRALLRTHLLRRTTRVWWHRCQIEVYLQCKLFSERRRMMETTIVLWRAFFHSQSTPGTEPKESNSRSVPFPARALF